MIFGKTALVDLALIASDLGPLQFIQRFRSNKALHLAGVKNPPIEAVQLVLEERTRFVSFPDPGNVRSAAC